jgi:hypothetical protein
MRGRPGRRLGRAGRGNSANAPSLTAAALIEVADQQERGNGMAAEGEIEKEAVVHRKGYEGFIFLMKWGAVISIVLGFIVILLIRE